MTTKCWIHECQNDRIEWVAPGDGTYKYLERCREHTHPDMVDSIDNAIEMQARIMREST